MFAMLPSPSSKAPSFTASPRMQGNLWKWTNYLSGWQQRWFVLDAGILAYYLAPSEINQGCRGSLKVASCDINVHPSDHLRLDIVMPGGRHIYLKASSTVERQQWVVALGTSKQDERGTMEKLLGPSLDQQVAVKSKMAELQLNCRLLVSQVSNMKNATSITSPDAGSLSEMATMISKTCDSFLKTLSECMLLSTTSMGGVSKVPQTPVDQSSPTSSPGPVFLGSHTKDPPPPSSQRPPTFSFFEHMPAVLPSIILPPLLPYPSPLTPLSSKQKKSSAGQRASNRVTQSLPTHIGGMVPKEPQAVSSTPSAQSTDDTDHGHEPPYGTQSPQEQKMENGNTACERHGPDPSPAPRTHSRTNSELFVTPTSTPTSSPPPSPPPSPSPSPPPSPSPSPSPSSTHTPLPHTLTPSQEAHITQALPSQPHRIGDRFPRSTVSSEIQSFFSKVPRKFEDIVLTADDGIPTAEFLASCRAVVPFFDTLSPTAFSPVKADINGNIEKLCKKYELSPEQFPTLQSIVLHELNTNTHEARNSATDALLWLKRAMEFIQVFVSEVAGGEHSLDIAAGKAYTKSLRSFHNWIVRGIFSVAVRAVPYHNNFLTMLGSDGTPDGNAAVTVHMADFARSLGEINDIINQFYQSHKLDTTPIL